MRAFIVLGLLLCGASLEAAPITSQGTTTYLKTSDGCTQQSGAGQVTAGAAYASCVNQEWLPMAGGVDTWFVNGATSEQPSALWNYSVHLEAGDSFSTVMSATGICCRSDYELYRGNDSVAALVFGWLGIEWESGHVSAVRGSTAQQVSTFVAQTTGDLVVSVYLLSHSFENNDLALSVDGAKTQQSPVPEPSTGLLSLGALCACFVKWARMRMSRAEGVQV